MKTRTSMKLYAERNEVAHADINELVRTEQWLKLADKIVEDLSALETEKLITEEQRAATKAAIWYKIDLHFEIFDLDEEAFTVSAMKAWPLDDKGKAVRTSVRPAPTSNCLAVRNRVVEFGGVGAFVGKEPFSLVCESVFFSHPAFPGTSLKRYTAAISYRFLIPPSSNHSLYPTTSIPPAASSHNHLLLPISNKRQSLKLVPPTATSRRRYHRSETHWLLVARTRGCLRTPTPSSPTLSR
ncbi:hypothetical protein B0T26DRAFT_489559 [Lasiosphaeria miniovina]|uniref:Uncharacterized protein n=1 Tax=Lasiosphaeria miniovina TaxID=1954250 RepID=A0AA39ZT39_9PEZI|nr:uncharacterized protein B0T26DRAFT_489559 [Lasiosphaeria miniovina]KAK0703058.1 hypothetical protein B0T26DRAFT_489559 [Lasiosphaeria miniovina]